MTKKAGAIFHERHRQPMFRDPLLHYDGWQACRELGGTPVCWSINDAVEGNSRERAIAPFPRKVVAAHET